MLVFILLTTALLQFIVIYLLVENGRAVDDLQDALNDAILTDKGDGNIKAFKDGELKYYPIHKGIQVRKDDNNIRNAE